MTSLRLARAGGKCLGWLLLLWSLSCMATSTGGVSQERRQHVVVVTAERFGAPLSGMAVERLSLQVVRDGERSTGAWTRIRRVFWRRRVE